MKKILSILVTVGLSTFIGCGSDGESTPTQQGQGNVLVSDIKQKPILKSSITLSMNENEQKVFNLSSFIVDDSTQTPTITNVVLSDGTNLPSGISFNANSITVNSSLITVVDNQNSVFDLNVTVTNIDQSASAEIKLVVQASANDKILILSNFVMNEKVLSSSNTNISVNVVDEDGVKDVSYNIYASSDTTHTASLLSGVLSSGANGVYTATVQSSDFADGTYVLVLNAQGKIVGGNANSEAVHTHNFEILKDSPTTLTQPSLSAKTTTSLTLSNWKLSDTDGVRNIVLELCTDNACANVASENTTGLFTTLAEDTTYYTRVKGEALNAFSGEWQEKSSSIITVKTDASVVVAPVAANHAPTATDYTYDAKRSTYARINLAGLTNDTDGDTLTVTIEGRGVLSGGLQIVQTTAVGLDISIEMLDETTTGNLNAPLRIGSAYMDYSVSDGTTKSATKRITFTNLSNK